MATSILPSFQVTGKSIDPDFKEVVNSYLYIPILGDLFPRLWGDRRTIKRTRFLIHTVQGILEVEESEWESIQVGGFVQADPDRLHW